MSLPKSVAGLTTKKLKAAKYNPRTITAARLKKLEDSMETFGDLSGVVFNTKTGNLISGHQRMTTVKGKESKIIQKEVKDKFGTVSVGHIEVKTSKGLIKIPFRAVDWEINKEKAANIAANAHGGSFDKEKLAMVLADLECSKKFNLDIVGLDPLTLRSLRIKDDDGRQGRAEFKEITVDSIQTNHVCPKCSFKF